MNSKDKNILDSVIYKYTATASPTEEENKILKETIGKLKDELEILKSPPLMVCEVHDIIDDTAIIKLPNGNQFSVHISDTAKDIRPGDSVLSEQKNLNIVKKLLISKKYNVERFVIIEKPTISWSQIGGLGQQCREIQEVVELPLKKPELFKKVGIDPPKCLFYL